MAIKWFFEEQKQLTLNCFKLDRNLGKYFYEYQ